MGNETLRNIKKTQFQNLKNLYQMLGYFMHKFQIQSLKFQCALWKFFLHPCASWIKAMAIGWLDDPRSMDFKKCLVDNFSFNQQSD